MSGKVTLNVKAGPIKGQVFTFAEHDTFIFGRSKDCHARLSVDDKTASRHHFLLEVAPPQIYLRDLGSLNGTFINGKKYGGRAEQALPPTRGQYNFPTITLKSGDEIRVGDTVFAAQIEAGVDDSFATEWRPNFPANAAQTDLWRTVAEADSNSALNHYEILRELGRGGMGVVYLAKDRRTGCELALKLMLTQKAADEQARSLFKREIKVSQSLRQQNIVSLYDCGLENGLFYFTMEYCPGGSLESLRLKQGGKISLPIALPIMMQALTGLDYAHRNNFVHRDLKPENILLAGGTGNIAKVADFGLAKSFEAAGLSGCTVTGMVGGTPRFMPREQLTNYKYTRPVSDVWSIAATFYYILTGASPRNFPAGVDPLLAVLQQPPIPIRERQPELPTELAAVLDRALSDTQTERYQDAGEFREVLARFL